MHLIDGKVHRPPVTVQVDAPDKDKALLTLMHNEPSIKSADWDFIDEVDPESHTIGSMGRHYQWMTIQ